MIIYHFKNSNDEILDIAYKKALIRAEELAIKNKERDKRKSKYLKRVANSRKLKGKKWVNQLISKKQKDE